MSEEIHIQLLSRGDTSEVSSYVPCSRLRDAMCVRYGVGGSHVWTTGGQVCRAGLRVGRFVEQDYERGGS